MEIHSLTDKEIKKIEEAASTVKKFARYIKDVNLDNYWLKKNLDESIKAGDVTNAQKCNLRSYESAEKLADEAGKKIREKCKELHRGASARRKTTRRAQSTKSSSWLRGLRTRRKEATCVGSGYSSMPAWAGSYRWDIRSKRQRNRR